MQITIETTQDEAEALYRLLAATRRTAKTLTIPRQAFAHLLMDHGRLLAAVERSHAAPRAIARDPQACAERYQEAARRPRGRSGQSDVIA